MSTKTASPIDVTPRARWLSALLALWLPWGAGVAAAPEPVVWRLESPGAGNNWLVAGNAVTPSQTARVEALLGRVNLLVIERELDVASLLTTLPLAMDSSGGARAAVDPLLTRRALAALRERGVSGEKISRLKPWALGLGLSAPPSQEEPLTLRLLRRAAEGRKRTAALETLREGAALLDGRKPAEQERMLRAGLARGRASTFLEETLAAWQRQDTPRLQQLLYAAHLQLITDHPEARQRRIAERIGTLAAPGQTMILVDPVLLTEKSILVRTLRAKGWSINAVRW